MLVQPVISSVSKHVPEGSVLCRELEFYQSYDWCLNPYLTVSDAISHLREEVDKLSLVPNGWQSGEVATNVFLLSCGLLNCIDECLSGAKLRLPRRLAATVVGRSASRFVETISDKPWSRRKLCRWRENWLASLNDFLSLIVRPQGVDPSCLADLAEAGRRLTTLLESPLPADLQGELLGTPTTFNRLDLTQKDLLALGVSFVQRFPERGQSILVVGLRTSGSYFAPLLRAFFEAEGYASVALLTIEPNKGVSRREKMELERFAARGFLALIVDDPPYTNRTMLAALDIASRAGFAPGSLKFLAATHPAKPTWFDWLPEDSVITLLPEQWHKRELLNPKAVELRLAEYYHSRNFVGVSVIASRRADEFNARLQGITTDERGVRLKRVFEVQLQTPEGEKQTKYVLAKSVGSGWLSYHAFLIAYRLPGYVPPILGLRDGILYMEWIPQPEVEPSGKRAELVGAAASYVAARARHLHLKGDTATSIDLKRYNNGIVLLEKALSRAYGPVLTGMLMQKRLGRLMRALPCPSHTLIDGRMRSDEWILGQNRPLKTDFEHHGMGKAAVNTTDPAYDLADTILNLALSPEEERNLIGQYVAESGDATAGQRLFMHKLLAGLWAMNEIQQQLFGSPRGGDAQRNYHQRFMNAWNFLTVQTARYCGSWCHPRTDLGWRSPLVVLDIDGVFDRRLFGFPCTTAAGMKALSLLSAHEYSVALNTARSVAEVKSYCEAYSLAGGVAEHGTYLWDAVRQRERVLISPEAERQLAELKEHLRRIPGVFLDERHQYSIRAFTYRDKPLGLIQSLLSSAHSASIGDGALAPISTHIVHQLLVDLRLDRLFFYHTSIDTHILAKENDKGTGLVALRDWALAQDAETIAVGDGEPDLAMFRVATRSFAPGNVGPRRQSRLFGCRIASHHDQQGLLEIVRRIVHPGNERCERCSHGEAFPRDDGDLFLSVLQTADQKWSTNLRKAVLNSSAFKFFIR
jgi:hydroxymethylpyrimidine pyrophosphatase-like HAD family hydrolase